MRVAIVEDERLEREAIKLLLQRSGLPVEVVFEAINGEDAVRLFRVHRPDLLLMDIQLPRRSGLSAAEEIARIDPQAQAVVLTAFNDFSYAHHAIRLQVVDYLLKPYNAEALYGALRRVQQRLDQRRQDEDRLLSGRRLRSGVDKYMKRDLLHYMITGKTLDEFSHEFLDEYFGANRHDMCSMVLWPDSGQGFDEEQSAGLERALQQRYPALICRVFAHEIVCLYLAADIEIRTMQRVAAYIGEFMELELTSCIGGVVHRLEDLHADYQRLKQDADARELESRIRSRQVLDMFAMEDDFYRAAMRMDWESCRQLILRLVAAVNRGEAGGEAGDGDWSNHYFSHLWRQTDRYIFQVSGRRKSMELKFTMDERLDRCRSVGEAVDVLMDFLQQYVTLLDLGGRGGYHKLIDQVKEHIEAHLADPLTLESLAEQFGFSSFYLSKLFKKYEGESFKNYIIRARMERAKLLLARGERNVSEVAAEVGYANPNYFSKAFKQYFGVSANEIRR